MSILIDNIGIRSLRATNLIRRICVGYTCMCVIWRITHPQLMRMTWHVSVKVKWLSSIKQLYRPEWRETYYFMLSRDRISPTLRVNGN